MKNPNPLRLTVLGLCVFGLIAPARAAFVWDASTATYVGGTAAGGAVQTGSNAGTTSGYVGACLDQVTPHTFRTIAGADLCLCHGLSFTDSGGNAVLVDNLRLTGAGPGSNIRFDLVNPLAAGDTLNLNFTFNKPIGTWEMGGNTNPVTGSNAAFATALRTSDLDETFNDMAFQFSTTPTPSAPLLPIPGFTPGPWEWTTNFNQNGNTSTGQVISGASNEVIDYSFSGITSGGVQPLKAVVRDDQTGTPQWNFTDRFTWSITAGANAIPTNTSFFLTLDGTPIAVPEPSRALLVALVGMGYLLRRRR